MAERLFKIATEIAEEATKNDRKGNYKQACQQYLQAAEILYKCIQLTRNPQLREVYFERAQKYVNRCKQIKTTLAKPHQPSLSVETREKGEKGDGGELAEAIAETILVEKPSVKWDDVANLEAAKKALREAIILPMLRPDFFRGARKPWKGILLFGPPGCGKTLLAKAVASEVNAHFFNVSAATLVSKWLGESEKLVRELFRTARSKQPAIIFIDEIDSIATTRDREEVGGERRLKTQFMQEIDGVTSSDKDRIVVLGATNVPWELDPAVRRRFEKRIYLGLPEFEARREIFRIHTKGVDLSSDVNFDELAKLTEGFSGADIAILCREALMAPIRELDEAGLLTKSDVKIRPVTRDDFLEALRVVKPSVSPSELTKFKEWAKEFAID
ncbi:MAG: AAA family ATPase [Candidatus Jordarchaeales archaeon]|nr:AAA family ATPase [Candidatus Jordarchaeia archaeon]